MSSAPSFTARPGGRSAFEDERRVVRALGAHERMIYHYSKEYPRHFCIIAELTGKKSREDYRRAFETVQKRQPMLQVYVDDGTPGGPHFCRSERALEISFSEEANWRRVVERELQAPFSADAAPLMRVSILQAIDRATLVLTFQHAPFDGLSGAYIVQDLMHALDGGSLKALPLLPPMEAIAAGTLPSAADERSTASATNIETLRRLDDDLLRKNGEASVVSTIVFDRETTDVARRFSKANGTTLHGAICAALICSATAENGQDSFNIISPINQRAMLGLDRDACGMLATSEGIRFTLKPHREFWELARGTTDGLALGRSLDGLLSALRRAELSLSANTASMLNYGRLGALAYDAIVTNLGELPIPTEVGSMRLEALWGPAMPGRFSDSRVLSVASLDGQLRIIETTPPQMPSILDRLRQTLIDACEDV